MNKILTKFLIFGWIVVGFFPLAWAQNAPPTISQVTNVVISEGTTATVDIQASDPDNQGIVATPQIVIIGSSTAAGAGVAQNGNITPDAWVERLRTHLSSLNISYSLVNLALSGLSSFQVMPSAQPNDYAYRNSLAFAFSDQFHNENGFTPNIVVVNLPSNDANIPNWDPAMTLANFRTMRQFVESKGARFVVTTTMPRTWFQENNPPFTPARRRIIQRELADAIMSEYGTMAVPIFYELANLNDYTINPQYGAGDNIHFNRLGHQFVFERVREAIRPLIDGRQKLTFNLSPALRFAKIASVGNGRARLVLAPKFNDGGRANGDSTYQVTVEVNDNQGGRANSQFSIRVNNATPGPDRLAGAQQLRSFTRPGGGTVNYYIYYPQDYDDTPQARFSLLVSLHGSEGFGENPASLLSGPNSPVGSLARQANESKAFPMIVVSPQQSNGQTATPGRWNPVMLNELLAHLAANFKVNSNQVYFTGYEWGGHGVWDFCQRYPAQVAAACVVNGTSTGLLATACNASRVPFRVWHEETATTPIPYSDAVAMVNAVNACAPAPTFPAELITLRGNVQVASTPVADNAASGIAPIYSNITGQNNLYDWLRRFRKANGTPSVNTSDFPSTTWNGTTWSNGRPHAGMNAIIGMWSSYPNGRPGEGSFNCLDLDFRWQGMLNINDGEAVTIHGNLRMRESGRIIVENKGSLVQKNGSTIISDPSYPGYVRANLNGRVASAYNLISTPVANFNLDSLRVDQNANWRFLFNENVGWQRASGMMQVGRGYSAVRLRYQSFIGVPNNGDIRLNNLGFTGNGRNSGYHLIGNPYPSALDLQQFMADNANLTGVAWVWNDNNAGQGGGNYETITGLSPTPQIAIGQGFFVRRAPANLNNTVTFQNGQRTGGAPNFFRGEGGLSRFKLRIDRQDGASDHLLVGFGDGFTQGIDRMYDGAKFDGTNGLSLAALHNGGRFAHTALPNDQANLELPLSLHLNHSGRYTFASEAILGQSERHFYLEDRQTGEWYYLQPGRTHTLELSAGNHRDRFYLRTSNEVVGPTEGATANLYAHEREVVVTQQKPGSVELRVYTLAGELVARHVRENAQENIRFGLQTGRSGIFVAKLLSHGQVVTKRIWLEN
jgi:lysophospholipase L1-like esterase/poly(3-hydroxybutyrate) depolymerase